MTPYDVGRNAVTVYFAVKDAELIPEDKAEAVKVVYTELSKILGDPNKPTDPSESVVSTLNVYLKAVITNEYPEDKYKGLRALAYAAIDVYWDELRVKLKYESLPHLGKLEVLKEFYRGVHSRVQEYL
jgi:hypothetical protein